MADPGATRPDDARFKDVGADGITISGTFEYAGTKTGSHRLDFVQQEGSSPPRLVHTVEIDRPGPWEVRAPKDFGSVYVVGFIDQKGDGPSADDPAGRTPEPLAIGAEDLAGVMIDVKDDPDLGTLQPGANDGPPPPPPTMPQGEASGPPPEGVPQGQGAPMGTPGEAPPAAAQ